MNSLLLRRRCAGAPRVGVTKIYVTGGEYQWFSPETYRDLNHFYFTTGNLDDNMYETSYNYSFIVGTVSGITTNNTAKVKLVYDSSSYTINSWCFNVSNVKFKLAPQIVLGAVTWIITATFTIKPKNNYCYSDLTGNNMGNGKITFLDLQNYPGFWDDEYCYFSIQPNSMYVETTDDLITDSRSFTKTTMSCKYAGSYPTEDILLTIVGYDEGTEDEPTGYSFYRIPEQTKYFNLPNNRCIRSIYIKDNNTGKNVYIGNCYITTSITQTNVDSYKLSITVDSSFDAFEVLPGGTAPDLYLVIQYYDIPA